MKKKVSLYKVVMAVVIIIMITFILTTVLICNVLQGKVKVSTLPLGSSTETEKESELIQTLHHFQELINEEYIGETVDEKTLMEGAIKGYIEALGDPYSEYYTAEEMKNIMEETLGNYLGVGMQLGADVNNDIVYLWPMPDSPAEKAGIQNDDILLKVNDVAYHASEMDKAVAVLKEGKEGDEVRVQVKRGEEIKDFVLKKEVIILKHISCEMVDEEIGKITIDSFEGDTADEFKEKYEELKQKGMKKLIVDVRGNGGGIVQEALKIADYFLEKDKIILVQTGKDEKKKISKSENDPLVTEPMVMLINENAASASEILAAAIKENERGKLIGKTTYGKGVIQTMRQFSDGSGIKLTTDEFLTPKENKINEVGVSPDIEVSIEGVMAGKPVLEKEEDTQLQRAIEELKK